MTNFIAITVVLILVLQIVSIVIIWSELRGLTPADAEELDKISKDLDAQSDELKKARQDAGQ